MQGLTLAFDLDGTLIDTAPDLVRAVNHVLARSGYAAVPGEQVRPAVSFGARAMIEQSLSHLQRHDDPARVDRALDDFLAYYAANIAVASRPFPGAEGALDRLAERGARLAVCTNKRADLSHALLAALALKPRFAAIAGRDTFAHSKPHPGHLTGAIAMAGGNPSRAVMVGDSEVDIATAKAAGIPVVAVTFGYPGAPLAGLAPEAIIDHYDELEAAIARLTG